MLLVALLIGWQANVHFTHDPPRKSGGSDGAIHVFYGMPQAELVAFLRQILVLKKSDGAGVAYGSVLGPQPSPAQATRH